MSFLQEMGIVRYFSTGLTILIVLGLFLFTTRKSVSPPSSDLPTPPPRMLTLYHYFSGSLRGGIEEMVQSVNAKRTDIQIESHGLDHEAFKTLVHAALDRDNPPDLFSYWAGNKTLQLVREEHLEPLDDLWKKAKLDKRFDNPVIDQASTYDGHHYLIPIMQHLVVFFYNRSLFDGLDLTPPTTWAELLTLAERFKRKGIIPFGLGTRERLPAQFWFDYLLLRTAGPGYRQELMEGKRAYTEEPVRRVFRIWGDLVRARYFNESFDQLDWDQAVDLVCKEQAAMTLIGTWALQFFNGPQCGLREGQYDFFVFPVIDPDVEMTGLGPIDGIVATKGADLQAQQMLGYFTEPIPQQLVNQGSGGFAPSSEVDISGYTSLRQRLVRQSRTAPSWAFPYDLATPIQIADRGLDSFSELLAFPNLVDAILVPLEQEAHNYFSSRRNQEKGN